MSTIGAWFSIVQCIGGKLLWVMSITHSMLYNYNIGDVLMTTRYEPPPLVMFPTIIVSSDQRTYGLGCLGLDNNPHVTTQWTQGSDTDCAQLQPGNCFKLSPPHYTPGSVVTAPHHSSVLSASVRIFINWQVDQREKCWLHSNWRAREYCNLRCNIEQRLFLSRASYWLTYYQLSSSSDPMFPGGGSLAPSFLLTNVLIYQPSLISNVRAAPTRIFYKYLIEF